MRGRRQTHAERGQAMVEFALVAPVLFLVVFGLMMTGYTFGKQLDLKGATRDGARRGAVSYGRSDAATLTRQAVLDSLTLTPDAEATVSISPAPPWDHGTVLTVTSSTPHDFSVMGASFWSGTLRAKSTIRVE